MVIILVYESRQVRLAKYECDHKLSLILLKNIKRGQKFLLKNVKRGQKIIVAPKCWSFHNYRNILFSGKPILRIGVAPFLFLFVALRFSIGAICLVSGVAIKVAMPSTDSFIMF